LVLPKKVVLKEIATMATAYMSIRMEIFMMANGSIISGREKEQ